MTELPPAEPNSLWHLSSLPALFTDFGYYQHSSYRVTWQLLERIEVSLELELDNGYVTIPISEELDIFLDVGTWIAASYPLTQGAFVVAGGRFGAIFGYKRTFVCAAAWWVLWSLISGFIRNIIGLSFARGLTGIGAAFMVPNAVALININLPPGKGRNVAMGLFGAMAPIGAAGGSLFFFLAMLGAVVIGISAFIVPSDKAIHRDDGSIDWLDAYLGIGGLILFNFVWNQAPSVGWKELYEYSLLIVSVLYLIGLVLWEKYWAKDPILPFDIWEAPSFPAVILVSLMAFMSFGVLLWYIALWLLTIRHWTLLLTSAAIVPLTVFGAVAAIQAAWLIPHLAAQYVLAIGLICVIASSILLFPAALLVAFCPDFIFTAAQIIASNSSIGLGFAGTVEKYTTEGGEGLVQGYRNALYFGIGLGVAALVLNIFFVRVEADKREGWEKEGQDNVIP
ncbi:MFS general substrate transporter [Bimuria novae-zelandiae CBS 107.79]|uniref:MFS general substrate transporter n=1 Tax=Bimuria novae-zelandiae CBS 107.79 TaxID=1447943 RepID=A0A6A5V496_9PLEO|nr:MFS general substrate transporter [Bimuria novae-zelandiae CBS 107.79]